MSKIPSDTTRIQRRKTQVFLSVLYHPPNDSDRVVTHHRYNIRVRSLDVAPTRRKKGTHPND